MIPFRSVPGLMRPTLRAARPYLWGPIVVNSVVFGVLTTKLSVLSSLLIGCILCLCASAGFIFNDLVDRKVDQLNGRQRLNLAHGPQIAIAKGTSVLLSLSALALGQAISPSVLMGIVVLQILLLSYSAVFRRRLFIATAICAFSTASPFWLTVVGAGFVPAYLAILGAGMFLFIFAREILLDIKDVPGDRALGRRTLPVVFGTVVSRRIANSLVWCAGLAVLVAALQSSSILSLGFGLVISSVIVFVGVVRHEDVLSMQAVEARISATRHLMAVFPVLVAIGGWSQLH